MRWTRILIPTLREDPQDAEVISHRLMLRAGLIRKLSAGAYSYLPLGLRSLLKVTGIIRQEMNAAGALEVLLPAIQPPELWERSGRIDALGEDMVTFTDRHHKKNILGPTHEEVITDLVANNMRSYRELPVTFYQIQTKFRDEQRPRFGVIRSREFIMKDAYSFDADHEGLNKSYQKMYDAYCRIFERCGLNYVPVEADTGVMGGDVSHEFMVPAPSGEDVIVKCSACSYAASVAVAACRHPIAAQVSAEERPMKEVCTPHTSSVDRVCQMLGVSPGQLIKTLFYRADGAPVALLVRGDHQANETKIRQYLKASTLTMVDDETIRSLSGGAVGFSGPVGLRHVRLIADHAVRGMPEAVIGANRQDTHLMHVRPGRDFHVDEWADIRDITAADPCPLCGARIDVSQAIEVGHTFKLGTKYSDPLGARFLAKDGTEKPMIMGCYGIGVNRILAARIETTSDAKGIVWPASLAPFTVLIIPLNVLSSRVMESAERLYAALCQAHEDVLLDDRNERAGVKFNDADLIGIPLQVVLGEKNLSAGKIEVRARGAQAQLVDEKDAVGVIRELLRRG